MFRNSISTESRCRFPWQVKDGDGHMWKRCRWPFRWLPPIGAVPQPLAGKLFNLWSQVGVWKLEMETCFFFETGSFTVKMDCKPSNLGSPTFRQTHVPLKFNPNQQDHRSIIPNEFLTRFSTGVTAATRATLSTRWFLKVWWKSCLGFGVKLSHHKLRALAGQHPKLLKHAGLNWKHILNQWQVWNSPLVVEPCWTLFPNLVTIGIVC